MITTEIKTISNCKRELQVTMPKEDLAPIREQQTRRVQKEVQFPGFRKGKAPLNLVKRNYGDAIEAYTMEAAVDESLRQSIEQNGLLIVGQPEAKNVEFNEDGNLVSVIEFETYPDVELKKYKGLELTRDKYVVTDKFVDDTIDRLRREKAEVAEIEGPLAEGHIAIIDMQELDEGGLPVVGKKYENMEVRTGQGRFDADIEKQLMGMKVGEDRNVVKEYPEDYPQKEFAGKKERYQITVKNIREETLPELNDEFVKDLGGEMETVEDLKKISRENLERQYESEAENRFRADLNQALLEENPFEIPQALVENYLDHIVRDVKQRDPKLNEDTIRQHYQQEAEFNIKAHYLTEQIGKKENIEVTEEDTDKFLEELEDEKVKDLYKSNPQLMDRVKEDILQRKIFTFLTEQSKIKENEIKLD